MKTLFFFIALIGAVFFVGAQKKKDVRKHIPTENLDRRKDGNKRSTRPKRKQYRSIYVSKANNTLYGNPCALEATRKMGFEYVVEPKGLSGSKAPIGKFFNNLWVKSTLVVLRSPFWKLILNNKLKKCREKSGDIVG